MTAYGMMSTYPPTRCGLASFAYRLRTSLLADHADEVRIVAVGEPPGPAEPAEVVARFVDGGDAEQAADALNEADVALIHHEFDIYSGADGQDVLSVTELLTSPTITAFHTVPAAPTPYQRDILEKLADQTSAIVVMAEAAADRLLTDYAIDAAKVAVIPHGADTHGADAAPLPHPRGPRAFHADEPGPGEPVILTWGLLGPGKGIEWGIEAVAALRAAGLEVRYVIAGPTHPKVRRTQGESYRDALADKARRLGVADHVEFQDAFRSDGDLAELISAADVVLLPYESTDQVTSGVLARALAAGRPVVATAFPHAREALADGAGVTVPHRDYQAIARAVERILTEPGVAAEMASRAEAAAAGSDWASVAAAYGRLTSLLRSEQAQLAA